MSIDMAGVSELDTSPIKVLRNRVQSSMEIMRNHMISNEVIRHKKKSDRSILEEDR